MKNLIKKIFALIVKFFTSNRMKSLYWRTVMMAASFAIDYALENLSSLKLNIETVALIGLVLGEISKAVNAKLIANRAIKSARIKK
jgi:hypothetical protein